MEQTSNDNLRTEGADHEDLALDYLLERGMRLVKKNFVFGKTGEIDLVMRDGEVLVFVEVKGRRNHAFGIPEEAVTPSKRKQIRRVAEGYIYVNNISDYEARFDVVAIDYVTGSGGEPEIRHLKDAF